MAYSASVVLVMIASPGDVFDERNLIRDIIHEWNDIHSMASNLVLLPVGWETHSSPFLGDRPQALINKQVLDNCDLLIGVFWTRIGTPTGHAESESVEEIRRHVEAGKPAMVYFSTKPVAPEALDSEQYKKLVDFRNWCKTSGLIETYENLSEFSEKFRRQLQIAVRDNDYIQSSIRSISAASDQSATDKNDPATSILKYNTHPDAKSYELSLEGRELLIQAANSKDGTIVSIRFIGGQTIQANGINFVDSGDRRSVARWEAALEELLDRGLVVALGQKNEIFELTTKGYNVADVLRGSIKT